MIAHHPLHGSGQAALPHLALALGNDAHATQGIRMADGRQRQPASDEAQHAIPKNAAVLAAPRQRAEPESPYLESKVPQRRGVHGHSVISDVSTHHRFQPFAQFGNGFMYASLKPGFHLIQLRLQPFAYRLPQHRKPSIAPLPYADRRKVEKVERLRFPFSTLPLIIDREPTELQQARFLGMQRQVELLHSFREFCPELVGIRFALESNHDVVRESYHDHIAVRTLLTPRLDSRVEYVMKIDVRQERRSTSALGRPLFHTYSFPILQHASIQPLLDEPHDAHRHTSLDFPMRPKATAALGGLGISRFPREESRYVHRVSFRAGRWHTSRYRCTRWDLPLSPTVSASRKKILTRLNTRPARSPVNASTLPLQAAPHDSGPMWVATPLSCDFCIHCNLAGLTGAQENRSWPRLLTTK